MKPILTLIIWLSLNLWAQSPTYTLKIEGMSCPACAAAVETQLKKISEVKDVKILLSEGKAIVTPKKGKKIPTHLLSQAITKAGFKATSVSEN